MMNTQPMSILTPPIRAGSNLMWLAVIILLSCSFQADAKNYLHELRQQTAPHPMAFPPVTRELRSATRDYTHDRIADAALRVQFEPSIAIR
jgi:hypothetical protein